MKKNKEEDNQVGNIYNNFYLRKNKKILKENNKISKNNKEQQLKGLNSTSKPVGKKLP